MSSDSFCWNWTKKRPFNEQTSIWAISPAVYLISLATANCWWWLKTPYRASLINTLTSAMFCVRDHLICMELWPSDKHRLAYMTSLLVFQYCLPLVLVLLCYLRIFLRLKRRRSHSYTVLCAITTNLSQVPVAAPVFCFVSRRSSLY